MKTRLLLVLGLALLIVALLVLLLDRQGGKSLPDWVPVERERASALYSEGEYLAAHEVLARVAAERAAEPQDLVNLAAVKLRRKHDTPDEETGDAQAARELCQRALAKDPGLASAHYVLGIVAGYVDQELEKAKSEFAAAVALAPNDHGTRFRLGVALDDIGDADGAIAQFEWITARGLEAAPSYYVSSVYRLQRLLRNRGGPEDAERSQKMMKEYKLLSDQGLSALTEEEGKYGVLGVVLVPQPEPRLGPAPQLAPAVTCASVTPGLLSEAGKVSWIEAADVDGDVFPDLVVAGENGLWIARSRPDGSFAPLQVSPRRFTRVLAHDFEHNSEQGGPRREFRMSLVALSSEGVALFSPGEGTTYVDESAALPALGGVRDALALDFDHEGHLDLLFATDAGLVLVRNDGVPLDQAKTPPLRTGPIRFSDQSAGIDHNGVFDWVLPEDFDADQDVDFLAGGASAPTTLFSSLRKGRFEAQGPDRTGLPATLARRPLLTDLDHDARVDVLATTGWQRNQGDGTFAVPQALPGLAAAWSGEAALADLDLDGELDLVSEREAGVAGRLGSLAAGGTVELVIGGRTAAGAAPVLADLDLDGDADFVGVAERGVDVRRAEVPPGSKALLLLLHGKKDNAEGIGALVEVRTSEGYVRRYARRSQVTIGCGGASPEVVRILWPNGVVQGIPEAGSKPPEGFQPRPLGGKPAGGEVVLVDAPQKEGAVGSCPFLYSWDGSQYAFISDVLGTTPLGLPMMDGMYVPPDHDELVRVSSAQCAPVEGEFRFQFTEELRETTYLDHAELWVVEHDAGVEVHPEERFSFPPFPPQTVHAVRGAQPIVRALDQDGRDWTEELTELDGVHAVPFRPLDSRYLGLATSHALEVTLPDGARTAPRVRLLMTGWLQWSDASVNVSAHRTGTLAFVPPAIAVPDGQGGWRDTGPPVGFPAGKTKTMVLDVAPLLYREDPRIRISSTIRLYWDEIRVALDDGDEPLEITKLPARKAELWQRGFSAPEVDPRPDQPERFDWGRVEASPRWNQHVGMLTRYGDVRPLLATIDDEFVILSSGDAIDLRFDATGLAPLAPGRTRTYLVYVDGWAKDADPNTELSQTVEPLPFHGMSGYPYADTEHYPDDAQHARYRREWNTRPGAKLIEDLSQPAVRPPQ
jgi:hypothetical protein